MQIESISQTKETELDQKIKPNQTTAVLSNPDKQKSPGKRA